MEAPAHLSVSQMKVFLQCPRKYFFQYVERLEPSFRPIALAFGTAWHDAIGHHLTASTREEPVARDELRSVFRESLDRALKRDDVPVLFDEGEDLGKCIQTGMKMLDAFLDRVPVPERVLGVEVAFSLDLVHPMTGDALLVPVIGALDALVQEGETPVALELKTAKRRYGQDQLEFDLQPTTYSLAGRALGFEPLDVVLVVTTKSREPDVQIERLKRTRADHEELAFIAASVHRAVEAGVDHPMRGWQCRGCAFAHACP